MTPFFPAIFGAQIHKNASLLDTFTDADSTAFGAHVPEIGTWTIPRGSWEIGANGARITTDSSDAMIVHDTGQANYDFTARLANFFLDGTIAIFGVVVRYTNYDNMWAVLPLRYSSPSVAESSTTVTLWRRSGGTWTPMAEAPHAWADGDVIRVEVRGASTHVHINGVSKILYVLEADLAATKVGLLSAKPEQRWAEASAVSLDGVIPNSPFGPASYNYLFPVFRSSLDTRMTLLFSADAATFRAPAIVDFGAGTVGDFSVDRHDGFWRIACSDTRVWLDDTKTLGLYTSPNLSQWTKTSIDVSGIPGIHHTSAPTWFIDTDGSRNLLFQVANAAGTIIRFFKITDNGDGTWTTPTQIDISSFPDIYIDIFVVKIGSTYHAVVKNEVTKYIEMATASSLDGPYTLVKTGDWAGWGSGFEGGALLHMGGSNWRIFIEKYIDDTGYYYADSTDNLATFGSLALVEAPFHPVRGGEPFNI